MNRIILNGKPSSLIKGLLIQSLPPVSKALVRTQVEEIDGRDGDIITKLGYSAYDKEISVGLYGNYDIDEVIEYFDSEGEVIFSNEPDKFYNYQVIQQIDFERLLRYKTASVRFHVQPFKYSAVDRVFDFDNRRIHMEDYSQTKNGLSVSVTNGVLTITGTGTDPTEFYIPIKRVNAEAGTYELKVKSTGNVAGSSVRLINQVPSVSLGELYPQNNETVSLDATLSEEKAFDHVWLYVDEGITMNGSLSVELTKDGMDSFSLFNRGNIFSRPRFTIYGTGRIDLKINNVDVLTINLGSAGYITIDSAQMNAYQGETLMNRSVIGDYDDLNLKVGKNVISWTGDVTEIKAEEYSRWI